MRSTIASSDWPSDPPGIDITTGSGSGMPPGVGSAVIAELRREIERLRGGEAFAKYEEETAKVNEFYLVKVPSTSLPAICQRVSEGRSAFVHFFFFAGPPL